MKIKAIETTSTGVCAEKEMFDVVTVDADVVKPDIDIRDTSKPKGVKTVELKMSTVRNQNILHFQSMFKDLKFPLPVYRTKEDFLLGEMFFLYEAISNFNVPKPNPDIIGYIVSEDDIEWAPVSDLIIQEQRVNALERGAIRGGWFLKAQIKLVREEDPNIFTNINLTMGTFATSNGVIKTNDSLSAFYLISINELVLSNQQRFREIFDREFKGSETREFIYGSGISLIEIPNDIKEKLVELEEDVKRGSIKFTDNMTEVVARIKYGILWGQEHNEPFVMVDTIQSISEYGMGQMDVFMQTFHPDYKLSKGDKPTQILIKKK